VASATIAAEGRRIDWRPRRFPWYLWCAVLAVTSGTIGAHWDISWHRSIGRDSWWTPPHIVGIYLCGLLAGLFSGYLILRSTLAPTLQTKATAVHVCGLCGCLGAFVTAWGGIAMLTSAPFDNWWHNAYGLDVKIVSPPHTLLTIGVAAVQFGALLLLLAEKNRAPAAQGAPLQLLMLYLVGLMLVFMMFFCMEYTQEVRLHNSGAYISIALGVPLYFATIWKASRHRWASTLVSAIYTAVLIGFILILPLFPATPRLGPVYTTVTHFVPPKFPILLLAPAIALDLLWRRFGERNRMLLALVSGPLFVLTLIAVEWPFANFLMSKASQNRFFATGYHDFTTAPWSPDVQRIFVDPQYGLALWTGLGWAMLCATISVWLGLALGDWMRKVQR
jgi:hypothetical protein